MKRVRMMGLCLLAMAAVGGSAASAASAKITLDGKSATNYAVRENCKVRRPAGAVLGDQMLMQAYVEDPEDRGPFTIASNGWQVVEKIENKSHGIWFTLAVFAKRYEAGDPSEYTVSWSGTARRGCGGLAAAWSGVSKSEPIEAHLGAPSAGGTTTVRAPSIVTTKPNSEVVMLADYNAPDTRTLPAGMEEVAGPGRSIIAQVAQPEAGATGDKNAKTGKADANVGVLVGLSPEVGEGPPPPAKYHARRQIRDQLRVPRKLQSAPACRRCARRSDADAGLCRGSRRPWAVHDRQQRLAAARKDRKQKPRHLVHVGRVRQALRSRRPERIHGELERDHQARLRRPRRRVVWRQQERTNRRAPRCSVGGRHNDRARAEHRHEQAQLRGRDAGRLQRAGHAHAASGMEEVAGPEGIIAQVAQPEAGATGDKNAKTGKADANVGVLVALSPEVGEGPPPPAPSVTNVSPNTGSAAGGTPVTITGTNLAGASVVKFGSTNATAFTVNSATSITATSPPGSGTVEVTVTTPGRRQRDQRG